MNDDNDDFKRVYSKKHDFRGFSGDISRKMNKGRYPIRDYQKCTYTELVGVGWSGDVVFDEFAINKNIFKKHKRLSWSWWKKLRFRFWWWRYIRRLKKEGKLVIGSVKK